MKLHNTLTRKIEIFKPLHGQTVNLYTCGPTVYDYYHIGNLRNAVFNDTLRRTLEACGYTVKHVMNITDVGHLVSDADEGEDKLEKGARREGKTVWDVARHYTNTFKEDMTAMNVLAPNVYHSEKYKDSYARATEFVKEQIALVELLLSKGFAYQTEQAIYFDVTRVPDYGILSGQRLKDKEIRARTEVITDSNKKSPHDFAVWFFSVGHFADHTMRWSTPWGEGFPGWHLECSAIIHALLSDPIDIHTGGIDHIGTHHPNEMAQTEAAYGHPLSRFWVHNEYVLVDGAKMAKSKGNAYTLKDIINHGFSPLSYRMLALQAHYRTELGFSWKNLEGAQNRLRNFQALAALRWQTRQNTTDASTIILKDVPANLVKILADDLNTPAALAYIGEVATQLSMVLIDENPANRYNNADDFVAMLGAIDNLLGLKLMDVADITNAQKNLVKEREQARTDKDWAKADNLRHKLEEQNIEVSDTPSGPVWARL